MFRLNADETFPPPAVDAPASDGNENFLIHLPLSGKGENHFTLSRSRLGHWPQSRALRLDGWMVIRIWECALHRQQERTLARLQRAFMTAGC